jgi:general secretion pathway protein B
LSSRESPEAPAATAAAQPRSEPLDVPARAPAPPLRAPEPAARPPVRAAAPAPEPASEAQSPASSEPTLPPPAVRTLDETPPAPRVESAARQEPASTEPPLPSASALAAEGVVVPPLRLELHGFSESPADRFVFINGTRYREGETLREGPRLLSIERNGAVLSQQGRRFMLAPQ